MRLGVGHDLAILGVGADKVHVVTLADLEDAILSVVGGVIGATDTVVLVLAVEVVVGAGGVANLHAELASADEEMPADDLLNSVTEGAGVYKATNRVTTEVKTERVHLSSVVCSDHVNLGLVQEASDLDVVGSLNPLKTGEGSLGDNTTSVTILGTPSHHLAFNFTNLLSLNRRSPEAEIIGRVEVGGLAHRLLVLGGGVALVVAGLATTSEMRLGVDLVGKVGPGVVLVIQGNFTADALSALSRDARNAGKGNESNEWKQTSE